MSSGIDHLAEKLLHQTQAGWQPHCPEGGQLLITTPLWRSASNTICCSSCELTNIIITVEKEECGLCKSINTTWCAGYCYTQDLVYKDPAKSNIQKTCTFKEPMYKTVKVPGCAHHADSLYTYPVASECHCGKCDSDSTDCTVRGLGPSHCSFSEIKE
ncbi:follitropin subunit beta-like [Sagmatias obliquidens]|uniref:follitropin subunit beta-like n=1 Tax=Sagmatias obliquidens TaxID=3371155 RepID=UPI000F442BF5|nr:follitropin subunit beta-like [Lagenorhynchus obliquidens]